MDCLCEIFYRANESSTYDRVNSYRSSIKVVHVVVVVVAVKPDRQTGTALKFSLDVQDPLVVAPDEPGEQRAVVLDAGRRVDGSQQGRAAGDLELDEGRRLLGAAVEQAVREATQTLDAQMTIGWTQQGRRDGELVVVGQNVTAGKRQRVALLVLWFIYGSPRQDIDYVSGQDQQRFSIVQSCSEYF